MASRPSLWKQLKVGDRLKDVEKDLVGRADNPTESRC